MVMICGVEGAMCWLTAVSAPACRFSNFFSCKQCTRQHYCQHAYNVEEVGNPHLAERSTRSSFPSCRGHVTTDRCQGTASSVAVVKSVNLDMAFVDHRLAF